MSDVYFITGATGAIGAALVPELLKIPDVQLELLIRANDQNHLQERFHQLCSFWEVDPESVREVILPLQGDISQPQFGLGERHYAKLCSSGTHIIHCAGNVRMNLPLEEARQKALGSAKNVIVLAQRCQEQGTLKKVEFVSTVGVGGRMQGTVPERFLTEDRDFHNTYEQAKAEAEDYIRPYAEEHQLPITVHRPSMVVGDSRTGKIIHFQVFYHICEFLSGRRTLGFIPNLKGVMLDIVPVDYVAEAIAWSSRRQESAGEVLHLCSGPEQVVILSDLITNVRKVYASMNMNLPRIKVLPGALYRLLLPLIGRMASDRVRRSMRVLPIFFEYLQERQLFENQKARSVLYGVWNEKKKKANVVVEKGLSYFLNKIH